MGHSVEMAEYLFVNISYRAFTQNHKLLSCGNTFDLFLSSLLNDDERVVKWWGPRMWRRTSGTPAAQGKTPVT